MSIKLDIVNIENKPPLGRRSAAYDFSEMEVGHVARIPRGDAPKARAQMYARLGLKYVGKTYRSWTDADYLYVERLT